MRRLPQGALFEGICEEATHSAAAVPLWFLVPGKCGPRFQQVRAHFTHAEEPGIGFQVGNMGYPHPTTHFFPSTHPPYQQPLYTHIPNPVFSFDVFGR